MTLRDLPQIQSLLETPKMRELISRYSRPEVTQALRSILDTLRAKLRDGEVIELPDFQGIEFMSRVAQKIEQSRTLSLQPVINATGVIIHTNLGRAPLAPYAIDAMSKVASGNANLELDLASGNRGSRHTHVEQHICELTGAEAAVVVNNCAAAVLLSLMATAAGRKVIASRGELIEIGGAFRLPDVIEQSGAFLREVGTTNKTRTSDYANAIDDQTAVLLKSHTSNFKIVGFAELPKRQELSHLAQERDIILMEDLGSGVLVDLAPFGLRDEPVVRDVLRSGVDLVMFSGDKLLGGPQAGIIAGNRSVIDQLKSHPLMRAVRIDKLSLAALEATLRLYRPPFDPFQDIPVLKMISTDISELTARAERVIAGSQDDAPLTVTRVESTARVGAGAMPEQDLTSVAVTVEIEGLSAKTLHEKLRLGRKPILGRIVKDRVFLDMRSMGESDVSQVVAGLRQIATS